MDVEGKMPKKKFYDAHKRDPKWRARRKAEGKVYRAKNKTEPVLYAFGDPDTGEIAYVGTTHRLLHRFGQHKADARNRPWHTSVAEWLRSLLDSGKVPVLVVLPMFTTEREAVETLCPPLNQTKDGEGWIYKGHP